MGLDLTRTMGGVVLLAGLALLLVATEPWDPQPDETSRCAGGPWSSTWVGSPEAFATSRDANHSAYGLRPYDVNDALPAGDTPPGWNRSRFVSATWEPPAEISGGFDNGTIRVHEQGHFVDVTLRFDATGTNETLEDLVVAAGENLTDAGEEEIRSTVSRRDVESRRTSEGGYEASFHLGGASIDVSGLLATVGAGDRWSYGQGSTLVPDGPHLAQLTVPARAEGWIVSINPSATVIEPMEEPATVVLASTGHGWIRSDTRGEPSDERVNGLLRDTYEDLDLGPPPERSWSWTHGSIC